MSGRTIFLVSIIFQGIDIFVGLLLLSFYLYNYSIGRCKWEVLYLCSVSAMIDILRLSAGTSNPAIVRLASGGTLPWIRYAGWMLTCPALLVLLSNLAGENSYNHTRATAMLMLDQAMILNGITSGISENDAVKVLFLVLGCFCLGGIFIIGRSIFKTSHETFPSQAKMHLIVMESCLCGPWIGYGVLFVLGPSALDKIDRIAFDLFLAVLDLLSKSLYSFMAWDLRWRILRDPRIEGSPVYKESEFQRVLLATEDTMNAVFFRQKMMHLKAEIKHVQSARELLRCISQPNTFDFVLLDWNLAVKDSFSVMFHLRRRPTAPNYLPIVAYGPKVDPDKAKEVARILRQVFIDDYAQSPFLNYDMATLLNRWKRDSSRTQVFGQRLSVINALSQGSNMAMPPEPYVPYHKSHHYHPPNASATNAAYIQARPQHIHPSAIPAHPDLPMSSSPTAGGMGQEYQNDFSNVDNIMAHIHANHTGDTSRAGGGGGFGVEPPHSPSRLRDLNGLSQIVGDAELTPDNQSGALVPHSAGGKEFPV